MLPTNDLSDLFTSFGLEVKCDNQPGDGDPTAYFDGGQGTCLYIHFGKLAQLIISHAGQRHNVFETVVDSDDELLYLLSKSALFRKRFPDLYERMFPFRFKYPVKG